MWILKFFWGGRHANMEGRILIKPHTLTKNYMQLVTTDKDVFNKDEPQLVIQLQTVCPKIITYIHMCVYYMCVCICMYIIYTYIHVQH